MIIPLRSFVKKKQKKQALKAKKKTTSKR